MALVIKWHGGTDWAESDVIHHDDGTMELAPVMRALGFITMAIGMWEITEKNAAKFYGRVHAYETARGSMLWLIDDDNQRHDRPLTPEDVREHIGLSTNAFPEITDAAFAKKLLGMLQDDAAREWRKSLELASVTES